MTDIPEIAASLSDVQREALRSFRMEPRQMGIGMMQFLPGMVKPDGINHPIFGSHYRLTDLGLAVRAHLETNHD